MLLRLINKGVTIILVIIVLMAAANKAAALSISTSPVTFPTVTLNGTDQTITGSTSAWQADANGETLGWNITVSSSVLENGLGKTITSQALMIRLLDENILWVSGEENGPVSTQTSYTNLSVTPIKIASAAAGSGNGVYDLTPDFQINIPAEAYVGTYNATLTISINAGP